ncbi:hypothetical protein [Limnospira platensis]|nr:hypothetical protein [Arthrospira platensis NCB002]WAK74479.1 hypothetical protein AP9108_34050 [Arthrospira sp. PCC 9108]
MTKASLKKGFEKSKPIKTTKNVWKQVRDVQASNRAAMPEITAW